MWRSGQFCRKRYDLPQYPQSAQQAALSVNLLMNVVGSSQCCHTRSSTDSATSERPSTSYALHELLQRRAVQCFAELPRAELVRLQC